MVRLQVSETMTQPQPQPNHRVLREPEFAQRISEILKSLAHPLRIQIVALLCSGPMHVNGLAEELGAKQSVISQQLRILRMNQLVQADRVGGFAHYSLAEPNLVNLVHCMEGCQVR